ncbi:DUF2470 domain-containing protein [Actinomadura sp. LD22]|uniref:DUF2470 domain-containing protein n=1 Tax=Actinomadura physcomitrii TaxID=2650748 RepID=A0A6I4ME49_9ACTN|nr:DUF2470 domain-containing protein [Actinomadura physcomitrii]MWA04003.1 DUF2470 domain-containing protein [Actinomadura physcomitrii]
MVGRADTTGTRVTGPTAAERARTLAYGMGDGVLVAPGVPHTPVPAYTTDLDGRPLLLLPVESALVKALDRADGRPATLRISDVAPVPLADRMRGRAWLHGWLTELPPAGLRGAALRLSRPHPRPELLDLAAEEPPRDRTWTVLTMDVAQVEIEDAWGGATLEPEEYAAGAPDPFVAIGAGILAHLDSCHRGELKGLLPVSAAPSGGPSGSPDGPPEVRPLGLDRYGMWLRCSAPSPDAGGTFDLRLTFDEPVSDLHGLRRMYRHLFAHAAP